MFDKGKLMLWEPSIYQNICAPAEVQIMADEASKLSHNPEEVAEFKPSLDETDTACLRRSVSLT